jgi:hypothetical protein
VVLVFYHGHGNVNAYAHITSAALAQACLVRRATVTFGQATERVYEALVFSVDYSLLPN